MKIKLHEKVFHDDEVGDIHEVLVKMEWKFPSPGHFLYLVHSPNSNHAGAGPISDNVVYVQPGFDTTQWNNHPTAHIGYKWVNSMYAEEVSGTVTHALFLNEGDPFD